MAESVDELVVKVGVKVDESEYLNLKKELESNKQQSINIKVKKKDELLEKNLNEKDVLGLNSRDAKKYLKNIINENDQERYSLSTQKANEYLSKILEIEKRNSTTLEEAFEKLEADKLGDGPSKKTADRGAIAGFIASVVGALYAPMLIIQKEYNEKLDRELNLASLSYQTGQTVDAMAKLNYQAKNVGLTLDQVVHNADNFFDSIVSGQDDRKTMLLGALGIDPIQMAAKVKTPEDLAKMQEEINQKAAKGLKGSGYPEFYNRHIAAGLSGIPDNEAFGYSNLNTKRNQSLAQGISDTRGSIGTRQSVMENFQDISTSLQKSTAAVDRLLSTGDVFKNISIKAASIKSDTVSFINATVDFTGIGNKGGVINRALQGAEDASHHRGKWSTKSPSSSAQTKAGG